MLLAVLTLVLSEPALDPVEVDLGSAAARKGQDLSKTLESRIQALGRWHDGLQFRATEAAVAITPKVASRWIGWLQGKHGWGDHQKQAAWTEYLTKRSEGLVILVRLTAFPKESILDLNDQLPPKPSDLENLTIEADQAGVSVEIRVAESASMRRPERDQLLGDRWLELADSVLFRPSSPTKFAYPLGDYHARFIRLVAAVSSPTEPLQLRIFGKRSPRTAKFKLE